MPHSPMSNTTEDVGLNAAREPADEGSDTTSTYVEDVTDDDFDEESEAEFGSEFFEGPEVVHTSNDGDNADDGDIDDSDDESGNGSAAEDLDTSISESVSEVEDGSDDGNESNAAIENELESIDQFEAEFRLQCRHRILQLAQCLDSVPDEPVQGLAQRTAELLRLVLEENPVDLVPHLPDTITADDAQPLDTEEGDDLWQFHYAIFRLMRVLCTLGAITVFPPTLATPRSGGLHHPLALADYPTGTFLVHSVKTRNRQFSPAMYEAALSHSKGGKKAAPDGRFTWFVCLVQVKGILRLSNFESCGRLLDAVKAVVRTLNSQLLASFASHGALSDFVPDDPLGDDPRAGIMIDDWPTSNPNHQEVPGMPEPGTPPGLPGFTASSDVQEVPQPNPGTFRFVPGELHQLNVRARRQLHHAYGAGASQAIQLELETSPEGAPGPSTVSNPRIELDHSDDERDLEDALFLDPYGPKVRRLSIKSPRQDAPSHASASAVCGPRRGRGLVRGPNPPARSIGLPLRRAPSHARDLTDYDEEDAFFLDPYGPKLRRLSISSPPPDAPGHASTSAGSQRELGLIRDPNRSAQSDEEDDPHGLQNSHGVSPKSAPGHTRDRVALPEGPLLGIPFGYVPPRRARKSKTSQLPPPPRNLNQLNGQDFAQQNSGNKPGSSTRRRRLLLHPELAEVTDRSRELWDRITVNLTSLPAPVWNDSIPASEENSNELEVGSIIGTEERMEGLASEKNAVLNAEQNSAADLKTESTEPESAEVQIPQPDAHGPAFTSSEEHAVSLADQDRPVDFNPESPKREDADDATVPVFTPEPTILPHFTNKLASDLPQTPSDACLPPTTNSRLDSSATVVESETQVPAGDKQPAKKRKFGLKGLKKAMSRIRLVFKKMFRGRVAVAESKTSAN
ncbi:hypothetical protein HDU96_006935 [Phlyctochytrium bullatum]|nr:hypothetical protein HDU96_006935 [Phlyctochytrium bullatum]